MALAPDRRLSFYWYCPFVPSNIPGAFFRATSKSAPYSFPVLATTVLDRKFPFSFPKLVTARYSPSPPPLLRTDPFARALCPFACGGFFFFFIFSASFNRISLEPSTARGIFFFFIFRPPPNSMGGFLHFLVQKRLFFKENPSLGRAPLLPQNPFLFSQ